MYVYTAAMHKCVRMLVVGGGGVVMYNRQLPNKVCKYMHVAELHVCYVPLVHLMYVKSGGVPDKFCIFPADES